MSVPTVGELFAGIGGFGLGFRRAGFDHAFLVEWDGKCQEVLARQFPGVPLFADVRDVGAHNLPPCDVLTFGSPCQDLSVAGKRAGFEGERSGLFFEAIRVIRELRERDGKPAIAIWENVPGAFSSNRGRDFAAALDALAECGALDIAWRVLDAQHFGLAQRRRRVFVVADFGGERAGEVLFEPESVRRDPSACRAAREDATGAAQDGARDSGELEPYLDAVGAIGLDDEDEDLANPIGSNQTGGFRFDLDGDTYVPELSGAFTREGACEQSWRGDGCDTLIADTLTVGANQTYGFPGEPPLVAYGETDPLAQTLGARDFKGAGSYRDGGIQNCQLVRGRVRRLTPTECARLQGFPDDWNEWLADSHRYRQFGNAVAVPVAEWLARRVALALGGGRRAVYANPVANEGVRDGIADGAWRDGASDNLVVEVGP